VDQALELEKLIQFDPKLQSILDQLGENVLRWTFTNANRYHAHRVLQILGVSHQFHGMVRFFALHY
jgi:FMN phosphatase YigB (HAD superfamily)